MGNLFQRCLGQIGPQGSAGLRLRLHIEPSEISMLPWEFIYSKNEGFLGTSLKTPVVRYLDILQPIRNLSTTPPVRILVLIPASQGIDVVREKTVIEQSLSDLRGFVEITYLEGNVTSDMINDRFIDGQYHIIHFIGHGGFVSGTPFLQVNTTGGETDHLLLDQFAKLLQDQVDVKLVVLNSCEGAALASGQAHVGMAPKLVESGIPAVIAMQYPIYDRVAIKFAEKLYHSLFKGWARGRVDVAMTHARNALDITFHNDPALGTPVLFMREPDGILFNLSSGTSILRDGMSSKVQASERTLAQAYERNINLMTRMNKASPDEDVHQDLQRQSLELKKLRTRLRLRKYSIGAAAGIALMVFFLSWVQLFDYLTLDSRVESFTMWMGDQVMHKTFHENIIVLAIDSTTDAALNMPEFGIGYRRYHATLIDSLTKFGAKVVAFDFSFNRVTDDDTLFASAIHSAYDQGTCVIVGTEELQINEPRMAPSFAFELQNERLRYGILCLGRRLGLATSAPLVLKHLEALHASLPLQAYAAYQDGRVQDIDFCSLEVDIPCIPKDGHPRVQHVGFSSKEVLSGRQAACPVLSDKDTLANLIVDLTPIDLIRAQTIPYQEVIKGIDPQRFQNKIVLVGLEQKDKDDFATRSEKMRYGVEFHADALNTLLSDVVIRPLRTTGQILITVGMALLGALLRYRWTLQKTRTLMLVVSIILYIIGTIWVYAEFRLLMNTLYHIAALLLGHWIAGKIINKYA
jgi:CHASE2 domain-containing sensor protein